MTHGAMSEGSCTGTCEGLRWHLHHIEEGEIHEFSISRPNEDLKQWWKSQWQSCVLYHVLMILWMGYTWPDVHILQVVPSSVPSELAIVGIVVALEVILYWHMKRKHGENIFTESILVMKHIGIQLTQECVNGTQQHRFYPIDLVQAVILQEGICQSRILLYLILLLRSGGESDAFMKAVEQQVIVAFPVSRLAFVEIHIIFYSRCSTYTHSIFKPN